MYDLNEDCKDIKEILDVLVKFGYFPYEGMLNNLEYVYDTIRWFIYSQSVAREVFAFKAIK